MSRSRLIAMPKFLRRRERSELSRRKSRRPEGRRAPRLETLESRMVLSTFTVLNTDDAGTGSLRQAIEDANAAPGADIILVRQGVSGTIELTSTLEITDDVRIQGPGADELEVSGMNAHRVFAVLPPTADDPAPTVRINELTISNGLATDAPGYEDPGSPFAGLFGWGGGLYNLGGTVHLDRVHMLDNQAVGIVTAGGAVANEFGGTLTVSRSHFSGNVSDAFGAATGGAIASDRGPTTAGGVVSVERSTFVGNIARSQVGLADVPDLLFYSGAAGGGAIGNFAGTLEVSRSEFHDNHAIAGGQVFGGAILGTGLDLFGIAPASVVIERNEFSGNSATAGAGIGDNGAAAYGGAIAVTLGSAGTIEFNTLNDNSAQGGAGQGTTGNGGRASGGAIAAVADAALSLRRNVMSGNEARGGAGAADGLRGNGQGGGLGIDAWEDSGPFEGLRPVASSFADVVSGNVAEGLGGGMYNLGTLDVERTVLAGNQAVGADDAVVELSPAGRSAGGAAGGGIANFGTLAITAATFLENVARGADDVDASATMWPGIALPGAAFGGGLANVAVAHVDRGRFLSNVAEAGDRGIGDFATLSSGGGIYNDASLTVSGSDFRRNEARAGDEGTSPFHSGHALGGALASGTLLPGIGVEATAELVVSQTRFQENRALGGNNNVATLPLVPPADGPNNAYGGAILVYQGSAELNRIQVIENQAIAGAGGAADNGSLGVGGGIFLFDFLSDTNGQGVIAELNRVLVRGNQAIGGAGTADSVDGGAGIGGGIAVGSLASPFAAPGAVTISDSQLRDNVAQGGAGFGDGNGGAGQGGGLANVFGGNTLLQDSVVNRNQAIGGQGGTSGNGGDGQGGGVYNASGATLELARDLILRNLATGGDAGTGGSADGEGYGGGVFNDGNLTLDLTFIYLNDADFGDDFWQVP